MAKWTRRELGDGAALCLELGAGLLENGAETSRVEETISLAGKALGFSVETFVTPTGITVTFGNDEVITRVERIKRRVINLDKVVRLNKLSRELHQGSINLADFRTKVITIRSAASTYRSLHHSVATALACGCFTVLLGGGPSEAFVAIAAGCFGKLVLDQIENEFPSFLSLFLLGFISTVFGLSGHALLGLNTESIVVGSLLHRMPGLAIVSAVRDLMAGELVAGVARAAEAILVALGMASGVLACLATFARAGIQA